MRCVIGDPQAPLARFFEILDRHGLRGPDGNLRPGVHLVSIGDHFDFGAGPEVARAAADGLALLGWLAAHPPEQVTILAGNHDLGRVGELVGFDDARFAEARRDAELVAADVAAGVDPDDAEARFLSRWPELPSSELARRDFSAFTAAQRALVEELLASGRMRLAYAAAADLLVCHAGATRAYVGDATNAFEIADALDARLDRALAARRPGERLVIEGLHTPGDAAYGEGDGMLYHRPASDARGRRRFDPRDLPRGLTQVIGHIRDAKCRKLLAPWLDPSEPELDGPLRHLVVRADGSVHYARGLRARGDGEAMLVFADGGMHYGNPAAYELFDLDARARTPAPRERPRVDPA